MPACEHAQAAIDGRMSRLDRGHEGSMWLPDATDPSVHPTRFAYMGRFGVCGNLRAAAGCSDNGVCRSKPRIDRI